MPERSGAKFPTKTKTKNMNTSIQFINLTGQHLTIWDKTTNQIAFSLPPEKNLPTPSLLEKLGLNLPVTTSPSREEYEKHLKGELLDLESASKFEIMFTKVDSKSLPPMLEGVVYIVHQEVAMNVARPDLAYPGVTHYNDSGEAVGYQRIYLSDYASGMWAEMIIKFLDKEDPKNQISNYRNQQHNN